MALERERVMPIVVRSNMIKPYVQDVQVVHCRCHLGSQKLLTLTLGSLMTSTNFNPKKPSGATELEFMYYHHLPPESHPSPVGLGIQIPKLHSGAL